ncbi:hypothetical protein B0H17DRAFT_1140029 [Mycena rosella]|uniref:Uncharacterized protein n=1 Tax=Mycena rosella TaxID=1033263 RepID=A0AAD7GBW6_MYCRO|nr:hypothetical protein B0H17DRAFT_1140029 [Mycena rosella]
MSWNGRSRLMNNTSQLIVPALESAPLYTQYPNLTARHSIESHRMVLLLWICHQQVCARYRALGLVDPSVDPLEKVNSRLGLAILNLDLPSIGNPFLELKVWMCSMQVGSMHTSTKGLAAVSSLLVPQQRSQTINNSATPSLNTTSSMSSAGSDDYRFTPDSVITPPPPTNIQLHQRSMDSGGSVVIENVSNSRRFHSTLV